MPGFVKTKHDEKKWSEAKQASGKQTDKDSKSYWKLANFIFHKMKKSQGLEKAEEFINNLNKSEDLQKSIIHEGLHEFGGQKHHVQIVKRSKGRYTAHVSPGEHPIQAPGSKHTIHMDHRPAKNGFNVSHDVPYGHAGHSNSPTAKDARSFVSQKVHEHHGDLTKTEENSGVISPKAAPTSVANPMKAGEQTTISKTPKAPGMFKSEDFKDVKHTSARKLRDFMTNNRAKK